MCDHASSLPSHECFQRSFRKLLYVVVECTDLVSAMASSEEQQTISVSSTFDSFPKSLNYLAFVVVGEPFAAENVDLIAKEVEKGRSRVLNVT